jgi:hypothetical protein
MSLWNKLTKAGKKTRNCDTGGGAVAVTKCHGNQRSRTWACSTESGLCEL